MLGDASKGRKLLEEDQRVNRSGGSPPLFLEATGSTSGNGPLKCSATVANGPYGKRFVASGENGEGIGMCVLEVDPESDV
jgi:hypothetical protein